MVTLTVDGRSAALNMWSMQEPPPPPPPPAALSVADPPPPPPPAPKTMTRTTDAPEGFDQVLLEVNVWTLGVALLLNVVQSVAERQPAWLPRALWHAHA